MRPLPDKMCDQLQSLFEIGFWLFELGFERLQRPVIVTFETIVNPVQQLVLRYPGSFGLLRFPPFGPGMLLHRVSFSPNSNRPPSTDNEGIKTPRRPQGTWSQQVTPMTRDDTCQKFRLPFGFHRLSCPLIHDTPVFGVFDG